MSGRHSFQELTEGFSPERRQKIEAIKEKLLADMPLHELRRVRSLTQQDIVQLLNVNQPAVPKLKQWATRSQFDW